MMHFSIGTLLVALELLPAMARSDSLKPVDVCDVASSLSMYSNKVVAVRGEFFSGRHGATVARTECKRPSPFKEFGSGLAINLAFPDDDTTQEAAVRFEVDKGSVRRLERAISDARDRSDIGNELTVIATFVGVLRVRAHFKLNQEPNGEYDGNGYGHLGRYPAELVLRKVTDVHITRRAAQAR